MNETPASAIPSGTGVVAEDVAPPPVGTVPNPAEARAQGEADRDEALWEHARASVNASLAALKLTAEEESLLAVEIEQLRNLGRKLDDVTIEIAAFGMVGRGKSSLLNALLGREAFVAGATHGTTVQRATQPWDDAALGARVGLPGARLVLVDTPGIDEVRGEVREALAREAARHADLILFVVSGDVQRRELEALAALREARKPILLVFNQVDRYPEADREKLYETIRSRRVHDLIGPDDVVTTAARPDRMRVKTRHADGSTSIAWEQPPPDIERLSSRIVAVLKREGKSLLVLNALLWADDLHETIAERKAVLRDAAANRLIWNFAIAKGAAVGLNPIVGLDMAGGAAVDVAMIVTLGKLYGFPITRGTAAKLLRDMLLALGALGVVEVGSRLLAGGIRSALAGLTITTAGLALPLTALGYGAISLAQGGTAAATSYVIGRAAKVYLRQGCQWGPMGLKTVINKTLLEARADSIVERLRSELKHRMSPEGTKS